MKIKSFYLSMAMVGFIAPWWPLVSYIGSENASPVNFFQNIFINNVSSAIAADLIISALVFCIFVYREGLRLGMQRLWIYPLITFGIGLSFAWPLFLYHRCLVMEVDNV